MTAPAPLLASAPIVAGSPQGGVWEDAALACWAWTCRLQACTYWESDHPDPEHAAIGLRVHERQECEYRPLRRKTDRPEYVREDPEDAPVEVPEGVELVALGAGPDRCVAPPVEVAA